MSPQYDTTLQNEVRYQKRDIESVPFNNQIEVIEKALHNSQKETPNTSQYIPGSRSFGSNKNNFSQNQGQLNKYALAAVAAAAAVQQQHHQSLLMQQYQQKQNGTFNQYRDAYHNMYLPQSMVNAKALEKSTPSSPLGPEARPNLAFDLKNPLLPGNDSNHSLVSPTVASFNQPGTEFVSQQPFSGQTMQQSVSYGHKPQAGYHMDSERNSLANSNSPSSITPHNSTSSNTNTNSPTNIGSTPSSVQSTIQLGNSTSASSNNLMNSPLLSNMGPLSSTWNNSSSNFNLKSNSSIWGPNLLAQKTPISIGGSANLVDPNSNSGINLPMSNSSNVW